MPDQPGFMGLLSDAFSNPLVQLGTGLLAAPRDATFGQSLASGVQFASGLQGQQARNALLREGLRERQIAREAAERRSAAIRRFVDGLNSPQPPDTASSRMPIDLLRGFAPTRAEDFAIIDEGGAVPGVTGPAVGQQPGNAALTTLEQNQPQPFGLLANATPQQRQVFGLLAEAAPEQAMGLLAQNLFPKPTDSTATIRTLRDAGIDPRSPEGQDLVRRSIAGEDISGQLAQLQVMQTQLEIQRQAQSIRDARRKAEADAREGRTQTGTLRREIFEQLALGREAATLLTDLEGTFGQTGFGGDTRRTLTGALALTQDMLGKDSAEALRIASKMERLNEIATGFGLENFEAFTGSISDFEAQLALGKGLSTNKTTQANREALADRLSIALSQADVQGFQVQDREEIETLITQLRGGGPAPRQDPPAGGGGQGGPTVNNLPTTAEELQGLSDDDVLKGLGIR